jgi:Fe-S cluster biogenesis protein NfuA
MSAPAYTTCEPSLAGFTGDGSPRGRSIAEIVERLEQLPGPTRAVAHECVQALLEFHGQALARLLNGVERSAGAAALEPLLRDDLVRTVLLIHGLHPHSLESRLQGALETVRPYMKSHGGDIELVSLQDNVARVRFDGSCQSCPASTVTMELAVRRAIEEACPDLLGLELETTSPVPGPTAPGVPGAP